MGYNCGRNAEEKKKILSHLHVMNRTITCPITTNETQKKDFISFKN
jgi:hypothetical protein